jgi:ATP-dependent DNA helicase DinG
MAREALAWFDQVVAQGEGMRARPGQRLMAEQVVTTFSEADLGKPPEDENGEPIEDLAPVRSISVVQAGTGVGKSLAYGVPAIALALQRNTRVLVSTATVALQEQLVQKDLPALARSLPQPFRFALAKGRGRYVCQLKLDRAAHASTGEAWGDDWALDDDLFAEEAQQAKAALTPAQDLARAERATLYQGWAQQLDKGLWDGDRDSLAQPPDAGDWTPVAADAHSCTAKHCPAYSRCSYFEARKALVGAQVIVANHDLLLASLGSRLLPELDNCLLVLDEAHHLPATALEQFASQMDLSRLGWVDRLTSRALRVGGLLAVEEVADISASASQVRQSMQDLARLVMDLYGGVLREGGDRWGPARARVPKGVLPDSLVEPLGRLAHHAQVFLDALRAIAKALRAEIRDQPGEAQRLSAMYAQLGVLAPRLEAAHATAQLLLQDAAEGQTPAAKWFTCRVDGEFVVVQAHASPVQPGSTLRHHLWSGVRAAVLTSATLTSCGRFDFFLRESGLHGDNAVQTLEVPSPFNYPQQGLLHLYSEGPDPRDAAAYTQAMVWSLLEDLSTVRHGALVLFTSREQMRQAVEALPAKLLPRVLVQNAMPRGQLLAAHRERVAQGQPSIVFGMQSFGEGLDLPGRQCEDLFITKLPFAPPDDPVGETRAEWLRAQGREPFTELVVPATAMRLAQWVGRAIRTEEDVARVHCYDRRLVQTAYGQRLLQGLPPFSRQVVGSPR